MSTPHRPHRCDRACLVPPSPNVIADLRVAYLDLRAGGELSGITFEQYLELWRARRRPPTTAGLDDGRPRPDGGPGLALIDRPTDALRGEVRTMVLLVDFPDKEHDPTLTPTSFEKLLFSLGELPTGSMREYYRLISGFGTEGDFGIDVVGDVAGWFRLPRPLSEYADGSSGMRGTFPRNAQGMARDAVDAALAAGVDFSSAHTRDGMVTALFVVHAGRGAEESRGAGDIWSHKWVIPDPAPMVTDTVSVGTYLTVPEDCHMGVCAHEWGHLAAQWADYYDTGSGPLTSNGLGAYCLMASGSWGNGGLTPTLPTGMLRMFHGWVDPVVVTASREVTLRPADAGGHPVFICNPATMSDDQYVLVEYRRAKGQDTYLPDSGVAIYVVDESIADVDDEGRLAVKLLQADGRDDLAKGFNRGNTGDDGDLFAGGAAVDATTTPALVLPDGKDPGVRIAVDGTPGADEMTITITI
ncbi:MAG TPA: M6 family metalloprotease domain-containing protein [Iamia sp.]|nr:M6 family metalloprotease domain-containing protein [Iamia sp.]